MRIHFAAVKQWLHYFLTPNSNHQLLTLHHTFSRMFKEFVIEKASFRDECALAELIKSSSNYIEWNELIICKFEDFYRWKTLLFQIEKTKIIFNSYQDRVLKMKSPFFHSSWKIYQKNRFRAKNPSQSGNALNELTTLFTELTFVWRYVLDKKPKDIYHWYIIIMNVKKWK